MQGVGVSQEGREGSACRSVNLEGWWDVGFRIGPRAYRVPSITSLGFGMRRPMSFLGMSETNHGKLGNGASQR